MLKATFYAAIGTEFCQSSLSSSIANVPPPIEYKGLKLLTENDNPHELP